MEQATIALAPYPIRRSARVILTVAAAVSMAARGQQSLGPCDAASFNVKACKTAIPHKGYCSGGSWVPTTYPQSYPYYYDSYQTYLSGGGVVTPASVENCHRPGTGFLSGHGVLRRGFGATGTGRPVGG